MSNFSYSDTQLSILLLLYHNQEPMSRYAIAKKLGSSKQTIGNNVKKLISSGVVEESTKGIKLRNIFFHPEVNKLFQEIIARISDYIEFEEMVSDNESNDMEAIMKNILMIVLLLSKTNFD